MPLQYPLSAVVPPHAGHRDDMALALTLTTISPEVGGVLVRGEKGTAKSTIVRALASVLPPIEVIAGDRFSSASRRHLARLAPDGPFAARRGDRDPARPARRAARRRHRGPGARLAAPVERALAEGVAEYEPGLLARAHRGILYVDEVNLLHDHLVDLLLDAAAMGRSTVERDGVSVEHAARFVLVGTMNPEEGELRPQLLDRFGLTVEVAAPRDPQLRAEVVRRRMAYDADPEAFAASFAEAEAALTDRIVGRPASWSREVELTDAALHQDRRGLRRVRGRRDARRHRHRPRRRSRTPPGTAGPRVTRADIRVAARLALPHRRRRNPFDAPGLDEDLLDRSCGDDEPEPEPPDPDPEPPEGPGRRRPDAHRRREPDGVRAADSDVDEPRRHTDEQPPTPTVRRPGRPARRDASAAGEPYRARLFTVTGTGAGEAGKRSRADDVEPAAGSARTPSRHTAAIHLAETIRAAAPHQHARGRTDGPDAASQRRPAGGRPRGPRGQPRPVLRRRLRLDGRAQADGAGQDRDPLLLLDAYQRRDKVGLVTFRGDRADARAAADPLGRHRRRAARRPAGRRTYAAGRGPARSRRACCDVERVRDPRRRPLLVVVTDGRATAGPDAVGARPGRRPRSPSRASPPRRRLRAGADAARARRPAGRATSRAEHVPVAEVSADRRLTGAARDAAGPHDDDPERRPLRRHRPPPRRTRRVHRRAARRRRPAPHPRRGAPRPERRAQPAVGLRPRRATSRDTRAAFRDHVATERDDLRRPRSPGERRETFDRIKVEGICESSLGVVVTYDPERGGQHVLGRHAIADTGLYSTCLAIQNLWLAATAEGLGVGWVSFYREEFLARPARHPRRASARSPGCASARSRHLRDGPRPGAPRLAQAPAARRRRPPRDAGRS